VKAKVGAVGSPLRRVMFVEVLDSALASRKPRPMPARNIGTG